MNILPTNEDLENEAIGNTISGNIKASLLTNIFYLATRLCIPPIVLSYVSLAEYGLWSYCFIILSYLGMGVFGITNVYVRYIAIYFAEKKTKEINQLLTTGIFSISSVCLIFLFFLCLKLPWLLDIFNVNPNLHTTGFALIIGTTIIFMSDMTIGAFTYLLQSLQLIVAEKIIWMISFTVETAAILFFLFFGFGIYSLLWAFAIRTAISIVVSIYVAKKKLPSLTIGFHFFNRKMIKLFLHFGGIVQLSGLLGVANRSIKKVLAGSFLGLETTGLFEVGEKFPVMSLNLPGSITAVFLPASSQFHITNQEEKIIQVYVKGSRLINLLTGSMMGFMAAFSIPLINAWLGFNPIYNVAASILTWFTIAYQMDTLTGPISAIYRAVDEPQKELYYGFTQLFLTLVAAGIGFYLYGPSVKIINITVSSMMVISALLYLYKSNNHLNINQIRFLQSVIIPGLYPYLIAFILWEATKHLFIGLSRLDTFWLFLVCSGIYLIVWTPLLFWGVCSAQERQILKDYTSRRK